VGGGGGWGGGEEEERRRRSKKGEGLIESEGLIDIQQVPGLEKLITGPVVINMHTLEKLVGGCTRRSRVIQTTTRNGQRIQVGFSGAAASTNSCPFPFIVRITDVPAPKGEGRGFFLQLKCRSNFPPVVKVDAATLSCLSGCLRLRGGRLYECGT